MCTHLLLNNFNVYTFLGHPIYIYIYIYIYVYIYIYILSLL